MIYLDNAATTYPKSEAVYQRMDEVNRKLAVNAGRGSYRAAREASDIILSTREKLLGLSCAKNVAEVFFTASATSAFNEIIGGLNIGENQNVYVSPFEHNAVMRTLHLKQKKCGCLIRELPIRVEENENGIQEHQIDLDMVRYEFAKNKPDYVFISAVSNVTGYILPVEEITRAAKEYGAIVTIDAAQAFGLIPVDLRNVPCDFYVFAGHKTLYGPFGAAGFLKKNTTKLDVAVAGGTGTDSLNLQMPDSGPERYEVGSPNIVAIAGLESALDEIKDVQQILEKEKRLTEELIAGLASIPKVKLYLPQEGSRVGIVSFTLEGYKSSELGMILDEDFDIAVRTGYHCAPLIHKFLNDEMAAGTVRASVSKYTTSEDIKALVSAIKELAEEM